MLQLHAVGDGSKVLLLADTDPKFVCLVGGITSHGFWVLVHRDINIRWWFSFIYCRGVSGVVLVVSGPGIDIDTPDLQVPVVTDYLLLVLQLVPVLVYYASNSLVK